MRSVHLAGTALEPSALGFGSASLMGKLGRRESVRKFEVAYDSGIRHFDTARAYGYGEAESALGDFLATRRDSVTVTTKLGIAAPRPSRLRTGAKNIARKVLTLSPRLRAAAGRRAAASVTGGHFGVEDAR